MGTAASLQQSPTVSYIESFTESFASPPCGAILIADYFVRARRRYEPIAERKFVRVSPPAVVAWALGSLVALFGLMNLDPKMNLFGLPAGFVKAFDFGLPAINGMVVAAVVYLALSAVCPCTRKCKCADGACAAK